MLSWITYAERQLTTEELSYALAVEADEPEVDKDSNLGIEDMVSICTGLATVDEESDVIRLVHYTKQEYFERRQKAWNSTFQEVVAPKCLSYLSINTFDAGRCYSDDDFALRITQNP